MTKREEHLADLRAKMIPGDANTVPHVVYDCSMPPYRYQTPEYGSGWATSDGRSGFTRNGKIEGA